MNIKTRLSEKKDLPSLVALNNTVWNADNSPGLIDWESEEQYERHSPPGSQIVAECEGKICGYISLNQPTKLPSNRHVMEIAIAVSPDYRQMGIGKMLLDAAYGWGKRNGKRKISLRVLSTNEAGIQFYLKCGFTIQGRLVDEFLIDNRYVDDIFMYKLIE
ncbi:GNAT family N-acetyltransferase [Paenibacillaceae bacterium WGS1546]|uniref:GNAT family N-acetyltransferase n=1 Tax=Cohnella sp. WGS1546 TaxID=3366810 RepID=UPI00372CE742